MLTRFQAVCNTVAYAHSKGVLHRDLKPGNVVLGEYGETIVVDWGLGQEVREKGLMGAAETLDGKELVVNPLDSGSGTRTGDAMGSPGYMSPEQVAGDWDRVGPASDVYSLGAVLYCVLTGRSAFAGLDIAAILHRTEVGDFPPPRRVNRLVHPALEAVCLKAMALRPEERYSSPKELAEEIGRWMADEPVSAWREPWAMRLGRWARHHRTAVAMAAVALVAGVIGLGVVAVLQARYNRRLEQANTVVIQANNDALAALAFLVEVLRSPRSDTSGSTRHGGRRSGWGQRADWNEPLTAPKRPGERCSRRSATPTTALGSTIGRHTCTARRWKCVRPRWAQSTPTRSPAAITSAMTTGVRGVFPRRLALHERTLELRVATLGPQHSETLTSRHNLAVAYRNASLPFKAIKTEEENIRLLEMVVGTNHPDTLSSRNNLANSYKDAGRLDDAIALYESTLERRRATLGPDHLDTLQSQNNLGVGYRDAGRFSEAIALFEETLEARASKLGPDHPYTLFSRHDLGVAYWCVGRYSEAIKLLEQVSRSCRGTSPRSGPSRDAPQPHLPRPRLPRLRQDHRGDRTAGGRSQGAGGNGLPREDRRAHLPRGPRRGL